MAKRGVSDLELRQILQAEIAGALGYLSDELNGDRQDALEAYKGDMRRLLPAPEGRSAAVSTDVQDTVEGILPSLMEIFTGGDEVARFEPVGPEDEEAAAQETDYVNHVFYQQNDGFTVLHDAVKDALMLKTGIIKAWWDKTPSKTSELLKGVDAETLAVIATNPDAEIAQQTDNGDGTFDARVVITSKRGRCRIEAVAPEEFLIDRQGRTAADCRFIGHRTRPTQADLIAMGLDRNKVERLETWTEAINTTEAQARDTINESDLGQAEETNRAMRRVEVVEAYLYVDRDGDGVPERRKILCGRDGMVVLLDEPDDTTTFAIGSPIRNPHRVIGRSIADLVMDIQKIDTAILRQLLDNMYMANNGQIEVPEPAIGENTISDMLTRRPGQPIRTKVGGMLNPVQTATLGPFAYPLLEYMEGKKENRTGVTRYNQGTNADSLNKTASGINQIMSAAQMRTRLIARILAETLVRPALLGIHAIVLRFGHRTESVRLRNKWVPVDPTKWQSRKDMTIAVALGTGSRDMTMAHLNLILERQVQAIQFQGGVDGPLVTAANVYQTLKKLAETAGFKSADQFFTDPMGPQAQQMAAKPKPPPPELQKLTLDAKAKEAELALKEREIQQRGAIEIKKAEIDQQTTLATEEMRARLATDTRAHEAELAKRPNVVMEHNMPEFAGLQQGLVAFAQQNLEMQQRLADAQAAMAQAIAGLAQQQGAMAMAVQSLTEATMAETQVLRGADGRVAGARKVAPIRTVQ